jgi:hypothetical protein
MQRLNDEMKNKVYELIQKRNYRIFKKYTSIQVIMLYFLRESNANLVMKFLPKSNSY